MSELPDISREGATGWAAARGLRDPRFRPIARGRTHLNRRLAGRRAPAAFVPTVARLDVHWALIEQGVEPLALGRAFENRAKDHLIAAGTLALRDLVRDASREHAALSVATRSVQRYAKPRIATQSLAPSGARRHASAGASIRIRDLDDDASLPLVDGALRGELRQGHGRISVSALLIRRLWVVSGRHRLTPWLWGFASLRSKVGGLEPQLLRLSLLTPIKGGIELRIWSNHRVQGGMDVHAAGANLQTRWRGRAASRGTPGGPRP